MSGYARNLRKECAGLVAGQAVLTAEIRTMDFYFAIFLPPWYRSGSSPFQYLNATNDIESKLDDSAHDYCPAAFLRLRFAKISM